MSEPPPEFGNDQISQAMKPLGPAITLELHKARKRIAELEAEVAQLRVELKAWETNGDYTIRMGIAMGTEKLERELAEAKTAAIGHLSSLNICAGAAGIGDHTELCGWIDKAKAELAEAGKPFVCLGCGDGNTGLYCLNCGQKLTALRWKSEHPTVAGHYVWFNQRGEIGIIEFRPKRPTGLSNVHWFGRVLFYGPIPEPMP